MRYLKNKIKESKPDFILGIGVAIGINKLRIEKLGLNYKYAKIPDNKGKKAKAEKIEEKGKLAYETGINVLDFVDSLKQKQIPCEISFNAGTYVCNYAYYNCLNYINRENNEKKNKEIKTLFIHIPASPKEVIELGINAPSFPIEFISKGLYETLKEKFDFD